MSGAWGVTGLVAGAYGSPSGLVAVGGGATVREIAASAYATRLADYTWADGEYGVVTDTGLVRIYDGTAGDLVRPCEYGTCTVRKTASGAVEPDTEGWTISESVAGNVSTDGTHVTCTGDGQLAQFSHSHGLGTTTKHSLSFYARVDAYVLDNRNRHVYLETGAYRAGIVLRDSSTGLLELVNSTGVRIASFSAPSYPSAEAYIELYVSDKHVLCYHNHSVLPLLGERTDSFGAVATTNVSFGNYYGNSGTNTATFRQIAHRTYT